MKELISTVSAAIGAFLCIAVGAWYVSPPHGSAPLGINDIRTDKATHYPYVAVQGRTWAVEMSR